ncbi:MAG: NAD-dependent DNA ligase LigA [Puniceicoccales bacterium]|jgi:DNA ligase (NAD+)|nr:NAD-dependent DNA ligase LigA [Puniceicoccales bacterium]
MSAQQEVNALRLQYEKLLAEIRLHDRLYYGKNNPKISDFEYDCLKSEAERLAGILAGQSVEPLEMAIGDDRTSGFKAYPHPSPMMSLANTYSREEIFQFDGRTKALLGGQGFSYAIEPKIDGVAVNLIYERGKFSRALTRGNGSVGDDVSSSVGTIKNLPLRIESDAEIVEIRGEIYVDEQTFTTLNASREERGLEPFSNPRNLAAGTVKTLDPAEVAERNLKLIAYAVGHCPNCHLEFQSDAIEWLKNLGFPSQEKYWIADGVAEAWECVVELDRARREFSYWTDGAVLKVNELRFHGELGATARAPRWAIAYKFAPERAVTQLKNIILQVGRTGVVTPVAELEPVQLSGTIVSRATLHNADEIAKKDIRPWDFVVVEKAGEIIPAVISVERDRRRPDSRPFAFPSTCPHCGSKLIRLANEVAWRCQNSRCLPQVRRRIEHFVSRAAMDIDGLGTAIIEKLMTQKKLLCVADIYRLTFDDFAGLEKLGTKSALKILNNVKASKARPLWRLLHGLGIFGVGEQTAKVLANEFHTIGNLAGATADALEGLDGIGGKLSAEIISFFSEPSNGKIIEDLRALGVCTADEMRSSAGKKNLNFSGKNFALTGTLYAMTRQRAAEIIEGFGGHVLGAVSAKTHVLISGDGGGSKLAKAKLLGIEIWDERKFRENLA